MLHPRQLVAARALAGWSQEELAAAAGVGLVTVKGLEAGFRDTKFSSVLAIVEALRRRGVELAQGSERYVGGVAVVRGSASDWLAGGPADQGDNLPLAARRGQGDDGTSGISSEPHPDEGAEGDATASHAGRATSPARRRSRKGEQ
jgi:transcriptional regulator with XRE-family HTH domain